MVPEYKKIRLKFQKTGNGKFISHLDLDRTMKSVLTRSKVKVEHTHGYNPRPYLVFSLPTSIGTESLCEFLDIKVPVDATISDIPNRLSKNLPPDIRVLSVYEPQTDFRQISYSEYEIMIICPDVTKELADKTEELFKTPVIIEKRTKKTESGFMDFDISPFVKSIKAEYKEEHTLFINTVVSAENATYINPEYVIKALCKYFGLDLNDPNTCLYTITRTAVYRENGEIFE